MTVELTTGYCVFMPFRDPACGGGKERFAYFLTVVHFRKVVHRQKIGLPENSRPVI